MNIEDPAEERSVPPTSDTQDSPAEGQSKRRVHAGMFEGMMPSLPFEVFQENRREMSRKYSEDILDRPEKSVSALTPIEIAILDATRSSPRTLEEIDRRLHRTSSESDRQRTADVVGSLVENGLLAPRAPGEDDLRDGGEPSWEPTPEGRKQLDEEGPLPPPPGLPEGSLYFGVFRGLIPEITRDEIDEARREMWGNFPRDFPE